MTQSETQTTNFYNLNIAPNILKNLAVLGFKNPTPIQQKAIPIGISGEDIIGIAQTGTGKTLAFAIPMIQRLSNTQERGLILLPTRELALQVEEAFKKISSSFNLRFAVLIGGASMGKQISDLRNQPKIIIATPGRLLDHLNQKTISLSQVKILVLDEADRMLDMGFEPQIKKILATVSPNRQTLLFSATMPERISQIVKKYMRKPVRVEVAQPGTTAELIEQEVFFVNKEDRLKLLNQILTQYQGIVLVFSRTKHGAKKITKALRNMGYSAAEIHSDRSLNQRREALDGFKKGKYRILVATDIAARGIDVTGIQLVINFDLPDQAEDYVHRIGRTARAGAKGKAISFAATDQKHDVRIIENLIRTRLPVKPLPELPEIQFLPRPNIPVVPYIHQKLPRVEGQRRHESGAQKRKRRRLKKQYFNQNKNHQL